MTPQQGQLDTSGQEGSQPHKGRGGVQTGVDRNHNPGFQRPRVYKPPKKWEIPLAFVALQINDCGTGGAPMMAVPLSKCIGRKRFAE